MPRVDVWDLDREVNLDCGLPRGRGDHYEWGKELGKGGFGEVKLVTHVATGRQYACKCIAKQLQLPNVSPVKRQQHLDNIKREVAILRKLRGTLNVVYLEDAFEDDKNVYLVMEWCKGGELIHAIGSRHYSELTVASFMRAVLRTLAQCHAHKILHRDVKPGNFMLLNDADRSPVKAIDFGLAVFFDPQNLPRTDLGLEGTPWYMAPEVLSSKTYPQSDVWAAGVMAFQLLSGKFPFDDWKNPRQPALSLVWRSILTEEPNFKKKGWDDISESAKDFVKSLLVKDPLQRPDAKTALQHPWLQGNSQQRSKGKPLSATIVQKLQRFGQVNVFKRTVLDMIASEVLAKRVETWKKDSSRHGGSLHGPGHTSALGLMAAAGRLQSPRHSMIMPHSVHGSEAITIPGAAPPKSGSNAPIPTANLNWSVHGPADVDANKANVLLQSKEGQEGPSPEGDGSGHSAQDRSHQAPSRTLSWAQLAKPSGGQAKPDSWTVHGGMAYKGPVKNPEAAANASLQSLAQSLAFRRWGQKAYGMQLNALKAAAPLTHDQLQLSPELRRRLEHLSNAESSPEYTAGGSTGFQPGTSAPSDISLMYWAARKQREEQQKVARLALDVSSHANNDYQKYLDEINGVNSVGSYRDLSRVSCMPPDLTKGSITSTPDAEPMDTTDDAGEPSTSGLAQRIGKAVKSVFKTIKTQAGSSSSLTRSLSNSKMSKMSAGVSASSLDAPGISPTVGALPETAIPASDGQRTPPATGSSGLGAPGVDSLLQRSEVLAERERDSSAIPISGLGKLVSEEDELTKRRSLEAEECGRRGHNKYASFIQQAGALPATTLAPHVAGNDAGMSNIVEEKEGGDSNKRNTASMEATASGNTRNADNGFTRQRLAEAQITPALSSRPSVDLNTIDIPPLLAMMSSPTPAKGPLSGLDSPPYPTWATDKMRMQSVPSHTGLSRLISDPKVREETDKLLSHLSFHANESISKEQFQHALSDLGYQLEESELSSLMGIVAKAGEDDTLNRAAFIASQVDWADFQNNYHTEWLECLHKAFEGLDTDNDGRIRKEELVKLLADRLPEDEVNVAVEDALMDVAVEDEGLDFEGFMSLLRINSSDSLYSLDQYDSRNVCWGSVHGGDLLKPLQEEA